MKSLVLSLFIFGLGSTITDEPILLAWEELELTFKDEYFEDEEAYYWVAQYSEEQKDLDSKSVKISGYLNNLGSFEKPMFILSADRSPTLSNCALGKTAKPDQLIHLEDFDINESEFKRIRNDKILITGEFQLNLEKDILLMNYRMREVQYEKAYE